MHEQPALVFIERGLGPFQDLFPLTHRVKPERLFGALEKDHAITLRLDLFPKGRGNDEPAFFIDLAKVFSGIHDSAPQCVMDGIRRLAP